MVVTAKLSREQHASQRLSVSRSPLAHATVKNKIADAEAALLCQGG